jgi:hypothetical protein
MFGMSRQITPPETEPNDRENGRSPRQLRAAIRFTIHAAAPARATRAGALARLVGHRVPTTALSVPDDRIDQLEVDESVEPSDANEPTENIEAAEPMDPIDRAEPTEPIDRTEFFEPRDRNESSDQSDHLLVDAGRTTLTSCAWP